MTTGEAEKKDPSRILDVLVAITGVVVLSPAAALVAGLILVTMGRPVLFTQRRAGRDGEPFDLVKFRTMTESRDETGCLLRDELRTTRVGRFLRRSRLDELPELWNVLRGEMSIVGPRPLLPHTVDAMGEDGLVRGCVRPGLTGWAQISGNAALSIDDKLALDLWYVANRSLWLDLVIMAKTIGVILMGEKIAQDRVMVARANKSAKSGVEGTY